jgi:hypothetical protein
LDYQEILTIFVVQNLRKDMKKYILLTLSILTVFASYAQTITLTPKVQTVAGPNSEDFKANCGIKNNSTDPTDTEFQWTFLNFDKPMGWQINLCDPFECRNDVNASESHIFTLASGETGLFYGDFIPNGFDGNSTLTVVVKSTKNPANADTAVMNAVAWVTAVKETTKAKSISFAPNPVRDQFTLKFQAKQAITVDIYNILGVKVKSFTHDGANTQVSIGELQNGVYFVRFTENGKLYTKQFIKAQ